jgi:hypothetical protein
VKARLDLAITDLGPTQLKNIADPIRVYSLRVGAAATVKPAPVPPPEKTAPPRLSIVVLPFKNLSSDPDQDYFADGVTENLTTDLSRIRNSFVIARNTAFTFKGKAVDAKQIGKELGVRSQKLDDRNHDRETNARDLRQRRRRPRNRRSRARTPSAESDRAGANPSLRSSRSPRRNPSLRAQRLPLPSHARPESALGPPYGSS